MGKKLVCPKEERRFASLDIYSFETVDENELDVDKVDGKHASELGGEHTHNHADLTGVLPNQHHQEIHIHDDRYYTETEIDTWKHNDEVEGHQGGFNADKVDGFHASELGGSIPSGVIVMWSGLKANIPSGWFLCDGQNGTPDLRNRFIYGVGDGEEAGGLGGSLTHQHSLDGSHQHDSIAGHTHGTQPLTTSATSGSQKKGTTTASIPESHTHTVTIPSDGGHQHSLDGSHQHDAKDHKPPYYKLCFIMKA